MIATGRSAFSKSSMARASSVGSGAGCAAVRETDGAAKSSTSAKFISTSMGSSRYTGPGTPESATRKAVLTYSARRSVATTR